MSTHQIRIIGGKYRGRKIPVIDSPSLRPTPNRVRETLFNWLQFDIADMNTLDLFAGSGILSLEALSRGAQKATIVEKDKRVLTTLKKACDFLPQESITYHQSDALSFIRTQNLEPYAIIFLDPPFNSSLLEKALTLLKDKISHDCLLYIETDDKLDVSDFNLVAIREQKASSVYFGLYQLNAE